SGGTQDRSGRRFNMFSTTVPTHMYPRLAGILGCTAALAFAGCATNFSTGTYGSTTPAQAGAAHVLHYIPTRSVARAAVRVTTRGVGILTYVDGPVLLDPKAYLICWGYKKYGDPDKVEPLLKAYFKAVGGSSHDNIYTQYYDVAG